MISPPALQNMLRDLIMQYGPPNDSNIHLYYSALRSSLVNEPREEGLLELSLQHTIPDRLFENRSDPRMIDSLVRELVTNYQVDGHAAEWMVKTWAKSMGMYVPPYQPPEQPYQQPPQQPQNTSYQEPENLNTAAYRQPQNTSYQGQENLNPTTYQQQNTSYLGQENLNTAAYQQPQNTSYLGQENLNTAAYQQPQTGSYQSPGDYPPYNPHQWPDPQPYDGGTRAKKTRSISRYIPIIGAVIVLLVIAGVFTGFLGLMPNNTDYKKEVDNTTDLLGSSVAHWNTLAISGTGEDAQDAAGVLYRDILSAEKRIDSVSWPNDAVKSKYRDNLKKMEGGAKFMSTAEQYLSMPNVLEMARDAGQQIKDGMAGIIEVETDWNPDAKSTFTQKLQSGAEVRNEFIY